MKCRRAKKFLTEYFYDQPGEERLRSLQKHFQSCYDCRQIRSRLEATLKLIDKRERLPVNEAFWQEFQTGLEQRLAKEDISPASGRNLFRPVRNLKHTYRSLRERVSLGGSQPLLSPLLVKSVSAVAAFLIIIGVGIYLFHNPSSPDKAGLSSPLIDDWVLLSKGGLEESLDTLQEVMDEEDIDTLLQIETYLEKNSG